MGGLRRDLPGSTLVGSVTTVAGLLAKGAGNPSVVARGVFLMLLNTAVDVGKAVLFFPILEKHGKRTALGYLATMIVEVVFLSAGALCLLMIVPLSSQHGLDSGTAKVLGSLAIQANLTAYQFGEMVLAFGALFFCSLLFRSRLIPRWLSVSGLVGYAVLLTGCIAEIFGIHIGTYCTIPGTFFEVAVPFWLFFKGFQPAAYGKITRLELASAA